MKTTEAVKDIRPKNFRERYKKIAQSKSFKEAYENKSLGESLALDSSMVKDK